jgi:hypothetical protein
MDVVRNRLDKRFEEGRCGAHVGVLHQLNEDELGGPIDGHEEIELAFGGAYLGDIEMKEANGIAVVTLHSIRGLATLIFQHCPLFTAKSLH